MLKGSGLVAFLLKAGLASLKGSRRYYAWMVFLFVLFLFGLNAYSKQLVRGLYITGMSEQVTWGLYISNFTFLVGMAASAVMLVIPVYIYENHDLHDVVIFGELFAIATIVMCLLFVIFDLGRPDRFWHLLPPVGILNWPASMLSWDVIVLTVYLLLNVTIAFYLLYMRYSNREPNKAFYRPLVFLSIVWAISIHTVTAFLLVGLSARPFWNSAVLAARFIASAFTGGLAFMAIVFQMIRARTGFTIGDATLKIMRRIIQVTLLINMFLLAAELFKEFYSEQGQFTSAHFLFFGLKGHSGLVPWIWTAVGLNTAATVLLVTPVSRNLRVFNVASVFLLIGIWIEKGMGLIIPGFIPTPLGEVVDYAPTLEESLVTVGIWAFGFLLYTLFLKVAVPILQGTLSAPRTNLAPAGNPREHE